jgi:hypothetical protein
MSGIYRDPDEDIREAEQRDKELERRLEPMEERGHGEGAHRKHSREPDASDDEMDEDNDGGPPSGRSR